MAKSADEPKVEETHKEDVVEQLPSNVEVHLDRDPNDPRNREYRDSETHSLNDPKMGGLGEEDK